MACRQAVAAPLAALVLATASLGLPSQALAHARLLSSTPAANGMAMPAPTELQLKFSEGIEPTFTRVRVTEPDQAAVKTGPV